MERFAAGGTGAVLKNLHTGCTNKREPSFQGGLRRQALQTSKPCSSIEATLTPPSFAKVFDARLAAVLATDGYQAFAPLHYGRIQGDVLQFVIAHYEQHERSQQVVLALEMGSLLLCEPHAFLSLDIGGNFPDEKATKTYVAEKPEHWVQTAELVVLDYLAVARARIDKRFPLPALMDHVFTLLGHSGSPHLWFTLAVGHARLGNEPRARRFAQEALVRYRHCAEAEPQATWTSRGEQRCELLVHELYAGRAQGLLDGWKAGTLRTLGIEALLPRNGT